MKKQTIIGFLLLLALLGLSFCVPALALEESEVEAAVAASSKEAANSAGASGGFFKGGLIGMAGRKITSSAVRTATTQTSAIHTGYKEGGFAVHTQSAETARTNSTVQSGDSVHTSSTSQTNSTARTDQTTQHVPCPYAYPGR